MLENFAISMENGVEKQFYFARESKSVKKLTIQCFSQNRHDIVLRALQFPGIMVSENEMKDDESCTCRLHIIYRTVMAELIIRLCL
jgi:hypothetical protein